MQMEFSAIVRHYARQRKRVEELRLQFQEARKLFELETEELLNQVREEEKIEEELENQIDQMAQLEYQQTQQKSFYGGIGIRVSERPTYVQEAAFAWCEKNFPLALQHTLNAKAFEKMAKDQKGALQSLVQWKEEVTVTFPKVLKLEADDGQIL